MSTKKPMNGEPKSGSKGFPSINPPVPILNIPNPGGTSSSKSPQAVVSSSAEATQHRDVDEPEVMVLDDDEEMDAEADGDGDVTGDDSFASLGAEDGKGGSGPGKLTLKLLLDNGLIEAGSGVMSIDYLGQTFKGDLLPNGQIKSQETGMFFKNPSAWAIYSKKIVNPAKKSGCGWASVKYKGRKMDHFKAVWASKMKALKAAETIARADLEDGSNSSDIEVIQEIRNCDSSIPPPMPVLPGGPMILRHSQLAPKHIEDNKDTLIEVESFVSVGKVQPFNVSISSSALLLVDLHAHLSPEPACGYLAGHWDLNAHNLAITHCYPCLMSLEPAAKKRDSNEQEKCRKKVEKAQEIESEIYNSIYSKHLTVVGWYRSKQAGTRALPSFRDSEAQLDHQIKLLGSSDATYSPCIGMIISPYTSGSTESELLTYWTVPPPENVHPQEYGKPLKMAHAIVTDPCLSAEVLQQIEHCIMFYKDQEKTVKFKDHYNSDTLYITKMGRTLLPKFPRDQDERLWKYIRVLLLGANDDSDIDDPLLIRPPSLAPSSVASTIPSSTSVSLSSMILNGDSSSSFGMNGSGGTMATAGLIGPRHGHHKNTTLTLVSDSSKSKPTYSRRKTHDSLEEEEIDDDEENAILVGASRELGEGNSFTLTPASTSLSISKRNGSSRPSNLSTSLSTSYGALPSSSSKGSINFTSTPISSSSNANFKSPSKTNSSSNAKNNKSSHLSDEVSFVLQRAGSTSTTPKSTSNVSITKTSKQPMNLRPVSDDSFTKKQHKSSKQKSPASNPFNISKPSTKNVPPDSITTSTPKEDMLSPTSSSNNRGAVEDSDDDSLIIQE